MAVLGMVLALACWPAVAGAAQTVIESSGPLTKIYVDNDLGCQLQASGDTFPSFFGHTEPGGCGTFAAFTAGERVSGESVHLFGPELGESAGKVEGAVDFTPVSHKLTGAGTEASPFVLTTSVDAVQPAGRKAPVAGLTETDTYVTGEDFFTTKLAVTSSNENPTDTLEGTIYHVGDCFLANLDTGFGAFNAAGVGAGSVACTITPNDIPPERFMAFTPVATEGFPVGSARYVESRYPTFWEDITPEGKPLPDTVDATTNEDNGMGLSWPIKLKGGAQPATLSFTTTVSPSSPPTSSSSAGACVPSGQVPVTVSAVNGNKAVNYVIDGGPVQSVATTEAGQATIALTPGQHTLEYWGEDLTGAQETPHHVLSVTVAAGGPSLTITSDQGRSSYEVGEAASVTIAASGPGLTSNPSAANVPIPTSAPGAFTVSRTAADACGTTSASFNYTVLSPPTLGKTVNVSPVSGTVLVALPTTATASFVRPPLETAFASLSKGLHFIPLTEARQIPVGSTLETTAGIARITTATASVGKTQAGEFGAGIFKLLQNRKQKGLTELSIVDNHTAKQECFTVGKKKAVVAAKHLSSKVLGRLNSSAHGKFTTRGQYSAATVRGTVWNVSNQCNGTLTKVVRGKVTVRDFRRRKTVTLFAGQSYLAKAP